MPLPLLLLLRLDDCDRAGGFRPVPAASSLPAAVAEIKGFGPAPSADIAPSRLNDLDREGGARRVRGLLLDGFGVPSCALIAVLSSVFGMDLPCED